MVSLCGSALMSSRMKIFTGTSDYVMYYSRRHYFISERCRSHTLNFWPSSRRSKGYSSNSKALRRSSERRGRSTVQPEASKNSNFHPFLWEGVRRVHIYILFTLNTGNWPSQSSSCTLWDEQGHLLHIVHPDYREIIFSENSMDSCHERMSLPFLN